jgi:hypothetical protein
MMSVLQGKGMWTFYDDIGIAVTLAPGAGIKYILCKISEKGKYDKTRADTALAEVRKSSGLVPIAWTYPYLTDVTAEVECIQNAFQAGFEAYVIDAESNLNFKFKEGEQFAQRVLAAGLDTTRIYLCGDPRLDTKMDEIATGKNLSQWFMAIISETCRDDSVASR